MAVLVVEDERKVAALVGAGLKNRGSPWRHATTVTRPGNFASTRSYEALILDIMLARARRPQPAAQAPR